MFCFTSNTYILSMLIHTNICSDSIKAHISMSSSSPHLPTVTGVANTQAKPKLLLHHIYLLIKAMQQVCTNQKVSKNRQATPSHKEIMFVLVEICDLLVIAHINEHTCQGVYATIFILQQIKEALNLSEMFETASHIYIWVVNLQPSSSNFGMPEGIMSESQWRQKYHQF